MELDLKMSRISLPSFVEMVAFISTSSFQDNKKAAMSPLLFTQYTVFESDEKKTLMQAVNLSESTLTFVCEIV